MDNLYITVLHNSTSNSPTNDNRLQVNLQNKVSTN